MKRPLVSFCLWTAALFWLTPWIIHDMGTAVLVLLLLMPLGVLILSWALGMKTGFDWRIPLLTAAIFATTVYVHYNESAWIYAAVYAAVALGGHALGAWMKKIRAKQ